MARADGSFRITSLEQHTLTSDDNGVRNTISIDQAAPTIPNNKNSTLGGERNASGGDGVTIENENQAPKVDDAESDRCDTND